MTLLLETRGVWQRFGGLIANTDISMSVGRGEIGWVGRTEVRCYPLPRTPPPRWTFVELGGTLAEIRNATVIVYSAMLGRVRRV